jgi:hypothetical protein
MSHDVCILPVYPLAAWWVGRVSMQGIYMYKRAFNLYSTLVLKAMDGCPLGLGLVVKSMFS